MRRTVKRGVRGRTQSSTPLSARHRPATEFRAQHYKRGVRGRESGSQERVSPRTNQPSNNQSVDHRRATESPLGKRRSGAKTQSNLSAEKREDCFVFLRLFLPVPADRSRVRLRPVPAPAPCRTQGVRGAADTPPAAHDLAFTSVRDVTADSGGREFATEKFQMCFGMGGAKGSVDSDITFENCVARNAYDDAGDKYWNADGFCAVPRVLEMMYSKLEAAGKHLKGFKKTVYELAWDYANNYDIYRKGLIYKVKRNLYDRLVYSKWRENLGGHEMLIVSGGSSIQAKIIRLFNAAKLHIYEGYGMTEASPVIAVNNPVEGINVIGTVGKPLERTVLKFAEDGEILTKGPHVMQGYYKDPEATRQVIDSEGFLHTGDIGKLVDGQYLQITDRKKEIFKLSLGKYVAPQVIENMLKESQFIQNCYVVGENQKFASAIIIPDFEHLRHWAEANGITTDDHAQLAADPKVIELIHGIVNEVNSHLAPHENIKRERVVADEWTTSNGLLSQTLKLKRAKLQARYSGIISEIYK